MKRLLAIIFLCLVIYGAYWFFFKPKSHVSSPKPEAVKVNKHSDEFNQKVINTISDYMEMKDSFRETDTMKIKSTGQKFMVSVDSINLFELQKDDSTIMVAAQQEVSDIKANAQAMLMENDIIEMQQDFRMVSENLYPFLKTIGYEGPKLYWLSCPTAFGENREGNWISNTKEILNPYLDKKNPKASANCGEIKDSIQ